MITDTAVEAAAAVLEGRGWERDEEMVEDVRAALEAVQASPSRPRWSRRSAASPASARAGRPRASGRRAEARPARGPRRLTCGGLLALERTTKPPCIGGTVRASRGSPNPPRRSRRRPGRVGIHHPGSR